MDRNRFRVVPLLSLALIGTALLGCAGNNGNRVADDRDRGRGRVSGLAYEQDLARARASITEAEQAGAAEFGSRELALAREKLRAAEEAGEDGNVVRARELALEADLDADLAAAMTRNQQTQALVTEIRSGLRTLEDELRRGDRTGLDRP